MPLYRNLFYILPNYPSERVADLFRRYTELLIREGANVRGIEHHGIRRFPDIHKRAFPTSEGERYFEEARFVSVFVDHNLRQKRDINLFINAEEAILRSYFLKEKSRVELAKGETYRNPFLNLPIKK